VKNVNGGAAETAAAGVACTLTINGETIAFVLPGRLVEMAPAPEKTAKRTTRRGGK
jgi:hypothetical protein